MANESIRVLAKITARADTIEAIKSVLADLVGPTRAEPGCIGYEVFQSRDAPTEFVTIEEWRDDPSVAAHMATAHVQAAFAKAGSLLAQPPDIRSYSEAA